MRIGRWLLRGTALQIAGPDMLETAVGPSNYSVQNASPPRIVVPPDNLQANRESAGRTKYDDPSSSSQAGWLNRKGCAFAGLSVAIVTPFTDGQTM
jgi:hypothetical protein